MWQWWNFSLTEVPAGKRVLRLSMDETAVCLFQGDVRGNLFLAKTDQTTQNATRGQQRTYLTHVAYVCDDPLIQRHLPQVVVGNERVIPAEQLAALRANRHPNLYC